MKILYLPDGPQMIAALVQKTAELSAPDLAGTATFRFSDGTRSEPVVVGLREQTRKKHLLVLLEMVDCGAVTPRDPLSRIKRKDFQIDDIARSAITFADARTYCQEIEIDLQPLQAVQPGAKTSDGERRYQMCVDAGLVMPASDYARLPDGIGKLALAEKISKAAFSKSVKKHIAEGNR